MVLASWEEMINEVGRRPGMWVGRERYSLIRSFVEGFSAARDDDYLAGFQHWISAQHPSLSGLRWSALLLHEAFPDRDQPVTLSWDVDDPANADWPRLPDAPVHEDDLAYPDDDAIAIKHLFQRLRAYADLRDSIG